MDTSFGQIGPAVPSVVELTATPSKYSTSVAVFETGLNTAVTESMYHVFVNSLCVVSLIQGPKGLASKPPLAEL